MGISPGRAPVNNCRPFAESSKHQRVNRKVVRDFHAMPCPTATPSYLMIDMYHRSCTIMPLPSVFIFFFNRRR